jgi:hypothetical protein
MKTNQYLLGTLLILPVLFIAGCQSDEAANSTPNSSNPAAGQTAAKEVSMADQTAFQGAMQLKDVSFCDKISDAEYKQKCLTTLQDNKISAEAIEKKDSSLCEKISFKDGVETCKMQLDIEKKALAKQEEAQKQQQLAVEISNTGDITACQKITDSNIQASCELNIITNKAVAAKDLKICKQGTTEKIISICEENAKRELSL